MSETLPPVKLRLTTIVPRVVSEYQGIPVFPPVCLGPGEGVDVWWYIEAGELSYRHAGSTLSGARVHLLHVMLARGVRLCALDVMAEFGIRSTRP
jgi:hypothetical protein